VVWSTGELLGMPAASAVVAQLAPPDLRGRYQGAYGFSFSAGMTLAPILSGLVLAHAGSTALWTACLAMGTATAALHFALGMARREPRLGEL
jgi:MFS family permease